MVKRRKLIGAQFLKIKTSYLMATDSCVQSAWIVSVYFEVTNYKKYTVFLFVWILFLADLCENVLNAPSRSL